MADEKKEEKTLEEAFSELDVLRESWKTVRPPWKIRFVFINREWSF